MWLLIITSALLFWLASILLCISRKSASIDNGGLFEGKNVLLVVAHPDDESMFVSPTLLYLTARGYNVHLLCSSTGNADGKGDVRKHELLRACAVLRVPTQQVKILDHPNLQDGFGNDWDHSLLAKIVKEEVVGFGIDVVITFDSYGVSGHCNHHDVHYGVWKLMLEASLRNIEAWELASTNILRKYSGPVDIWTSILCAYSKPARSIHLLTNKESSEELRRDVTALEPMGLVPETFLDVFQLYIHKHHPMHSSDRLSTRASAVPGNKQGAVAHKRLCASSGQPRDGTILGGHNIFSGYYITISWEFLLFYLNCHENEDNGGDWVKVLVWDDIL